MRLATPADRQLLVELMAEFYAESDYPLDRDRTGTTFGALLADPRLGGVWLIESGGHAVGYAVVTLGYSMEYGGLDGFLDDFFIQPGFRNAGLGTAALARVREYCTERGVRALHLEVARGSPAHRIYRKAGFENNNRELLTLRLANPLHQPSR